MKGNIFTISILGAAVALSGCSSGFKKVDTLDGAPKWYNNVDVDEGAGYGKSNDFGVSDDIAYSDALGNICMKTAANVKAETRSTSVQTGKGAQDKVARKDVVKVTTTCNVKATEVEVDKSETVLVKADGLYHTFQKVTPGSVSETIEYEIDAEAMSILNQAEGN